MLDRRVVAADSICWFGIAALNVRYGTVSCEISYVFAMCVGGSMFPVRCPCRTVVMDKTKGLAQL